MNWHHTTIDRTAILVHVGRIILTKLVHNNVFKINSDHCYNLFATKARFDSFVVYSCHSNTVGRGRNIPEISQFMQFFKKTTNEHTIDLIYELLVSFIYLFISSNTHAYDTIVDEQ